MFKKIGVVRNNCHCLQTHIKRCTDFPGSHGSMWKKKMSGGSGVSISRVPMVATSTLDWITHIYTHTKEGRRIEVLTNYKYFIDKYGGRIESLFLGYFV